MTQSDQPIMNGSALQPERVVALNCFRKDPEAQARQSETSLHVLRLNYSSISTCNPSIMAVINGISETTNGHLSIGQSFCCCFTVFAWKLSTIVGTLNIVHTVLTSPLRDAACVFEVSGPEFKMPKYFNMAYIPKINRLELKASTITTKHNSSTASKRESKSTAQSNSNTTSTICEQATINTHNS